MGRIIDIEQFIKQYKCDPDGPGGCFCFEIEDELLPWNNKTFVVTFKEGKCELDSGMTPQFHMKMSIGTFTTLLMGYKTAEKLLHMGKNRSNSRCGRKESLMIYSIRRYHMYLTIYNNQQRCCPGLFQLNSYWMNSK